MRMKIDFVTNSSSTGYVIIDKNNPTIKIYDLIQTWCAESNIEGEDGYGYSISFDLDHCETFKPDEIEEFKKFCNFDKELDWIQKATGFKYNRLKSEAYNISLQHLNNKNSVHFVVADRSITMEEVIRDIENIEIAHIDGGW